MEKQKKPSSSKKKKRIKDPFAAREAAQYEKPIPSREYVLAHLKKRKKPAKYQDLLIELGLEDELSQEALRRRLKAMIRDDQLVKLRGGLFWPNDHRTLLEGRVVVERGRNQNRYHVVPDDQSERVLLEPTEEPLYQGNRVVISVLDLPKVFPRLGKLVEVLLKPNLVVSGRYIDEQGVGYVIPQGKEVLQDILIPPGASQGAKNGQIVVVEITNQSARWEKPIGEVRDILGDENTPGIEIKSAIRTYGLPEVWPDAVEDELRPWQDEIVPESAKQNRVDLRQLPLVTIDGEDAKDFDDAVYCESKPGGGWKLWVAIADVSHYVKSETALDLEAMNRGNSVYFPGKVIPMLPEILSNGLCSLKPSVDRLCLVAEMSLSAAGKLTRYEFHEAVMHSQARLTYTKVAALLEGKSQHLYEQHQALYPHLKALQDLYRTLYQARLDRGAIEFETTETRIVFDTYGKISRIEPLERNEAHRIIEECMLCANVAAARFLKKHKMPALYRNHEGPPIEKLFSLRQFLSELGLKLGGEARPEPLHYTELLQRIRNRPDANIIQMILLRSLSQAVYSPDNLGHFGLAYPEYVHFTSPIRRYPDLFVHRQIRKILRLGSQKTLTEKSRDDQQDALKDIGFHCSMTERRADDATRDAVKWLKCQYLRKHVGEIYEGVISGVTHFGFFVELKTLLVDGLVHVSSLHSEYYYFDATRHCLIGESSHRSFKLGDTVTVRVTRVDVDSRKIDFDLIGQTRKAGQKKMTSQDKIKSQSEAKKKKTLTKQEKKLAKKQAKKRRKRAKEKRNTPQ